MLPSMCWGCRDRIDGGTLELGDANAMSDPEPTSVGWAPYPGAPMPFPGPLSGVTVVSIEQAVAAPFATRQLADLGARVIKIERTGVGDFAREYDTTVKGLASHFVW